MAFMVSVIIIQALYIARINKNKKYINDRLIATVRIVQCFQLWIKNEQGKKAIAEYLRRKDIKRIAIYGFGFLGSSLYEYLDNDFMVEIVYIMDKNKRNMDIKQLSFEDNLPETDLVIVTPMNDFAEIERKFLEKGVKNVMPIEALMILVAEEVTI